MNKQEGEVAKGGFTSCASCKSEGGTMKVLTKKKCNNDEILHNAKVNNTVLKQ